jgi:hypothetical protein
MEVRFEATVSVCSAHPFGNDESIVLVRSSSSHRKISTPERRIDFSDHRAIGRHVPTVERPGMDAARCAPPDVPQPWNPGVRGLRYRALHVKMKNRVG